LLARQAEERRAARALGVTISLAALLVVWWAVLIGLAIGGTITVVAAIALALGGYVALAAALWGLAGRG
jgi:hypothetical protein